MSMTHKFRIRVVQSNAQFLLFNVFFFFLIYETLTYWKKKVFLHDRAGNFSFVLKSNGLLFGFRTEIYQHERTIFNFFCTTFAASSECMQPDYKNLPQLSERQA